MNRIFIGDALKRLKNLPGQCVQTCVTSPPYFGLRDYGVKGQMGLEETSEAYVEKMVELFREVRRVLRDDGTLWLNIASRVSELELPWLTALALKADGWLLQADNIWNKTNGMPTNALKRPSRTHEYVFLFSKSESYYYDADAVLEPYTTPLNRYGGEKKKLTDNLKDGSQYASAHRERNMRPKAPSPSSTTTTC